jgi:hypothetical protein
MLTFLALLFITTVLVAATLWTGRQHKRAMHYTVAVTAVLALLVTIREAGIFGEGFEFESLRLNVHLTCAAACMLAIPGVIFSGFKLRRNPAARRLHQRWIFGFLLSLLATFTTAGWMFLTAVKL